MKVFYELMLDGNDKIGGTLYAPPEWPYPISRDGMIVKNWESLVLELRDGQYCPFHTCNKGANLVSKELKNLFVSFMGNNNDVEFLPVKVVSTNYGEKEYFIIHFRKIFDVIDKEKSVYVKGTGDIIKLRLDFKKVKDLKVFNSASGVNNIFVSKEVRDAIKKAKMEKGCCFMPVYCGDI